MPLPMKTLREAAIELGMSESEIRAMVDMKKIRAVLKKGIPTFAPDEIARLKRQRKTVPESAAKASPPTPAKPTPVKPAPVKAAPIKRAPPPPPRLPPR